jgi:hypothetical protein
MDDVFAIFGILALMAILAIRKRVTLKSCPWTSQRSLN